MTVGEFFMALERLPSDWPEKVYGLVQAAHSITVSSELEVRLLRRQVEAMAGELADVKKELQPASSVKAGDKAGDKA